MLHVQAAVVTAHAQGGAEVARVPDEVSLPVPPPHPSALIGAARVAFRPPAFGVTVLGSSHGFDPAGTTSGYILWINHRGTSLRACVCTGEA